MQTSIDQTKWYDRIWASLIFFTRLPFWRLHQPPRECYQRVVEQWPLVGWLTGGVMAATLYFGSMVMPYPLAVVLAIAARLLLTGALHEDGLADFIMKDSHIGTYGVLGLILYLALLAGCLLSFTPRSAALLILAADPFAKMVASQLILMMPYARKEEEAKAKTVYRKFGAVTGISLAIQGLGSAADGGVHLADGHRLGDGDLPALSGDVFPLSAHVAQDSRLHRRLLRCGLSVGGAGGISGGRCAISSLNDMKKLILITGGQRSGKSQEAEALALRLSANPVYVATAHIWDEEFRERVRRHQERRGPQWHDLTGRVAVIDCVTLWLTNFFFANDADTDKSLEQAKAEFDKFTAREATYIFVTNEIGSGGVSENAIQRKFTDLEGWMNQYIASKADEVILMVSGIPVKIK